MCGAFDDYICNFWNWALNCISGKCSSSTPRRPLGKLLHLLYSIQSKKSRAKNICFSFFQGSVTAAFSQKALENPPWSGHDGNDPSSSPPTLSSLSRRWTLPIVTCLVKNQVDRCHSDSTFLQRNCNSVPTSSKDWAPLFLLLPVLLSPLFPHVTKQKNTLLNWLAADLGPVWLFLS